MPDNQEDGPETQDEPSIFELPGDWFLRNILETLVSNGVEIGLTVTVGGAVISGIAISGGTYIDQFSDALADGATEGDLRKTIADGLRGWKQIYEKPADAGDDWKPGHVGYIHLKDARFYAPGQGRMPSGRGMLWRGRIEEIDGFSLGNFQID